jgi:hypothetical protein
MPASLVLWERGARNMFDRLCAGGHLHLNGCFERGPISQMGLMAWQQEAQPSLELHWVFWHMFRVIPS